MRFGRSTKKAEAADTTINDVAVEEPVNGDGVGAEGGVVTRTETTATQDVEYPGGIKLLLLMLSIFISMFLVALDRLIIATAVPKITDEFHSEDDIGWYGSAYLLSVCSLQLLFGKLYGFYSIKYTFLISILLFEVGSAICGAAPTSNVFIVGRAISGIGGAGLMCGVLVIITYAVPLHKRPLYQGLFGAIFGVASVLGPLLGGVFTSDLTWRWCFYINLPLGGAAMVFVFFLLDIPDRDSTKISTKEKLSQLDVVGTSLLAPGIVCLLLALQWGGLTYPWKDGRIIALFVLGGVLLIGFIVVQILMPKTATVPPRIFIQRSVLAGFYGSFCIGSQMMIFVYYLPIWFQAIEGVSAFHSGIRTLPLVMAMNVSSILTGVLTTKVGYYTPFMLGGVCIMAIGAGLLTTLDLHTSQAMWVGYQFLYGFGLGMSFQAPNLAAQTVLSRRDVSIGVSLMFFSQLLGGAIFTSVGQNLLNNRLLTDLSGVPGFNASTISNSGATSLTHLSPQLQAVVLPAYNNALATVFRAGLALACLSVFGALAMEWVSVKKNQKKKQDAEEAAAEGATEKQVEIDDSDEPAEKGHLDEAPERSLEDTELGEEIPAEKEEKSG